MSERRKPRRAAARDAHRTWRSRVTPSAHGQQPWNAADADAGGPWPKEVIEQITAIRTIIVLDPGSAEEVSRQFAGAKREIVVGHLDTLTLLGEMVRDTGGTYRPALGQLAGV